MRGKLWIVRPLRRNLAIEAGDFVITLQREKSWNFDMEGGKRKRHRRRESADEQLKLLEIMMLCLALL